MKLEVKVLRNEILKQEKLVADLRAKLAEIEKNCPHKWQESKETRRIPGYTAAGQTHVGPYWIDIEVPAKEVTVYVRTCMECGRTEKTENTVDVVEHRSVPVWGK